VTFWLNNLINALEGALAVALIFLVSRLLLKRSRVALAVGVIVLFVATNNGSAISGTWLDTFNVVAFTMLITVVIHRFGLLATASTLFVDNIVADVPLTTHLSLWWSTPTLLTMSLLIGLVSFAYYAARGGQPLFGEAFVD
jgi:hypothetical protein